MLTIYTNRSLCSASDNTAQGEGGEHGEYGPSQAASADTSPDEHCYALVDCAYLSSECLGLTGLVFIFILLYLWDLLRFPRTFMEGCEIREPCSPNNQSDGHGDHSPHTSL